MTTVMNRPTLPNSISTLNISSTFHTKSLTNHNFISWSYKSPKKMPTLQNVGKRVSEECFNLRNSGSLMRVCCVGGNESDQNGNNDAYYMRKGIELARIAIGCTSPNPMVGCVIVKDGMIVGQGFHPKAGQPHAEVFALRDAGELAENATAYVTLEPCNHYGKTPPCSEALIEAKVKKVVVGMVDPNPIVSSRGIDKLREAGIEVVVGVEEELCKKLNEAFIHKMLHGKPFVTLRYSISINGAISKQMGDHVSESGGYYSKLLQEYDAVIHLPTPMTQEISFLSSQEPNSRQPLHIFIAKNHDSLNHILNLSEDGDFKAIVFADKELSVDPQMSQKGVEIVVTDHISMDAILDYCSKQGFCNVLIDLRGKLECYIENFQEDLNTNLVQKVVVEILPLWAENEVSSSLAEMSLTQRKRLKDLSTTISGNSVVMEGYF